MYIFRRDDSNACSNGITGCMPSFAITGSDPSEKEDDPSFGPSNYGKPGPHRFIGVAMVAGMVFLALTAYFIYGKWPRRMRRRFCSGRRDKEEEEGAAMKQVAVVLETTYSTSSSSSTEEKPRHDTQAYRQDDELGSKLRDSTSRGRSRSRSKHKHGKSRRTIVASPKEAKEVEGEPAGVIVGWEADYRRSTHYEILTPNHNQEDPSLEVHIQKPSPAFQR